jgi:glucokinase
MEKYIAVDIGGTQLRASLYPAGETKALVQKRIPTQAKDQTAVDRLLDLLKSIWPDDQSVKGIGLAAPGPLNPRTGVMYAAPNIPGWVNLPLAKIVHDVFKVPTFLGNDANMAALGEWKYGAGRGYQHLLYITVSTGIGGGVLAIKVWQPKSAISPWNPMDLSAAAVSAGTLKPLPPALPLPVM